MTKLVLGVSTAIGVLCLTGCTQSPSIQDLQAQVWETELAFAQTMADRDYDAFISFLSEESVTFAGESGIRGREAVAEGWRPHFDGLRAPFSWEPAVVEVLGSGTLAFSSGPVRDPDGNIIGTFNTVWRREADGSWKVVFDKGCSCPAP